MANQILMPFVLGVDCWGKGVLVTCLLLDAQTILYGKENAARDHNAYGIMKCIGHSENFNLLSWLTSSACIEETTTLLLKTITCKDDRKHYKAFGLI